MAVGAARTRCASHRCPIRSNVGADQTTSGADHAWGGERSHHGSANDRPNPQSRTCIRGICNTAASEIGPWLEACTAAPSERGIRRMFAVVASLGRHACDCCYQQRRSRRHPAKHVDAHPAGAIDQQIAATAGADVAQGDGLGAVLLTSHCRRSYWSLAPRFSAGTEQQARAGARFVVLRTDCNPLMRLGPNTGGFAGIPLDMLGNHAASQAAYEGSIPFARSSLLPATESAQSELRSDARRPGPGRRPVALD
jgi:hypothetical protein